MFMYGSDISNPINFKRSSVDFLKISTNFNKIRKRELICTKSARNGLEDSKIRVYVKVKLVGAICISGSNLNFVEFEFQMSIRGISRSTRFRKLESNSFGIEDKVDLKILVLYILIGEFRGPQKQLGPQSLDFIDCL